MKSQYMNVPNADYYCGRLKLYKSTYCLFNLNFYEHWSMSEDYLSDFHQTTELTVKSDSETILCSQFILKSKLNAWIDNIFYEYLT